MNRVTDKDLIKRLEQNQKQQQPVNVPIKSESSISDELLNIPYYGLGSVMEFPSMIGNLLSQVPETAKKLYLRPEESLGDLAGGIMRGSQRLASSGLEAGEYLTRKAAENLPGAGKVPYWNAREFMGLEGPNKIDIGKYLESENPDPLLSKGGQYLGVGALGPNILKMLLAGGLTGAIQAEPGERVEEATKGLVNTLLPSLLMKGTMATGRMGKNIYNRGERETKFNEAEERHANAVNAEKEAKEQSFQNVGTRDVTQMQKNLQKEREALDAIPKEKSNLPIQSSEASQRNLQRIENHHREQQANLDQAEHNIGQHLNQGAAHDVRAANQILDIQEGPMVTERSPNGHQYQVRRGGIRDQISQIYNDLTNRFRSQNVVVNNNARIRETSERLRALLRERGAPTEEVNRLREELERLHSQPGGTFRADEYLTMLRSAKDYAREARRRAFQPDMNAEERAGWHREFNELDNTIEQMEDHLENAVGKEDADLLRDANRAWRTQVKPLQRNNTYQTILHKGRIEGDIMQKLRGHERGDVLMRDMILDNPDLLKNVIGQRYANEPGNLSHAGELENTYISRDPELVNMIHQYEQQGRRVNRSNEMLTEGRNRHNQILERERKAHKIAESEKEIPQKRADIEKKIKDYEDEINKLRAMAKAKNISLEKKLEIEEKLKQSKKSLDKVKKTSGIALGGWIGSKALSALKHLAK